MPFNLTNQPPYYEISAGLKTYEAILTWDGATWDPTELFNNLGTVTVTSPSAQEAHLTTAGLYTLNKTVVLYSITRTGIQAIYLNTPTVNLVKLNNINQAASTGDQIHIQIRVYP